MYRPSLGFRYPDEKVKTHNELEKAVKRIPYVKTSCQCHLHYRILLHVIALILYTVVLASRCCSHRYSLREPNFHEHGRSNPSGDGNDCGSTALYCPRDPIGRRAYARLPIGSRGQYSAVEPQSLPSPLGFDLPCSWKLGSRRL